MQPAHLAAADAQLRDRFQPITAKIVAELAALVGAAHVSQSAEQLAEFSHDWTEDLRYPPEVVVAPADTAQIAAVLQLANRERIPVTPVGARTGLSGGMLPVFGGIALNTARLNQILHLDLNSQQVTVQPGVITQVLQETVLEHGLMYAPDPSSRGSCFIGGNLAENAGGAHAVKYGITKDYVLALEAVTGAGDIIRTGAKVLKDSTGYNLTQLLVGSEGTLAVITEATLKLLPAPTQDVTMLVPFPDAEQACAAVSALFQAGITPSALEFMEADAIRFAQEYLQLHRYELAGVGGHLLVELDGHDLDQLIAEAERVAEVVEQHGALEILFADTAAQKTDLWRLRRCIGEAVKGNTIYKEEDTVVPRAELPGLLRKVKELSAQYGFQSVCYGHAGDGNLHVNIIKNDLSDAAWNEEIPAAIRELFVYVAGKGGTLSGEHGIGWVQRRYLDVVFSPTEIALQRSIKQVFDPNGILNPGKIF